MVLDVELVADQAPGGRRELSDMIRGDDGRDAKAGNPVVDEGRGAGVGSGGGEGKWPWAPGSAINDGEEMGELGGRREGANEVNVNV